MRGLAAAARTAAALLLAATTAGCLGSGDTGAADGPHRVDPSPPVSTLTPIPLPPQQPPSGRVSAEIRQSSRDVALGRAQVWVHNDTARALRPKAVVFRDARLPVPLRGDRLRPIPSQSERGFPLLLPDRPVCGDHPGRVSPALRVLLPGGRRAVPVQDATDVIGRFAAARCLELALAEVVRVSWSERVVADRAGEGGTGTLVLRVRPTGRSGPPARLVSVSGTPLFTPVGSDVWRTRARLTGPDAVRRLELPVRPARCDAHAFLEAGGATAFRLRLRVGGQPGQLLLRMPPDGADAAIAFAQEACGLAG
ncbi:hypothetical protein [Nocardioides ferulae]|uniref:hypothetical protein n=1 Tax=Nocardioides ferulae TaxID=2340821 RepID=UPI000EACF03E|nr:hypothetical protein [Nocardioides ferulae]